MATTKPLTQPEKQASTTQRITFNIEPQRAHSALLQFAGQANLSLVLPLQSVQHISTNALYGEYSPQQAIDKLLAHTELQGSVNARGQVTIRTKNNRPTEVSLFERFLLWLNDTERLPAESSATKNDAPNDPSAHIEKIVVHGLRASVQQSADIKRDANQIIDAIQAVDIGQFPEQNLAESIQRIAGVSIDRAEGEGQFVTVRGFGPEFNQVQINGRKIATDNLGRDFSFDVLSSDMVSGVSVLKTNRANMDSGGIGSTIDIHTAKPFTTAPTPLIGSVHSQYDSNSEQFSPQFSVMHNYRAPNNRLGLLFSYSEQRRDARIDEAQIDGWLTNTNVPTEQLLNNESDNRLFVPRNYDQRVRFDQRKRVGGTLVLQYRPSDYVDVTLDYLRAELDIATNATSIGHWFTSNNLEQVITDENGTAVAFSQNQGHATDFHARTFDRPSQLHSTGLNIDWHASERVQINADIAQSVAKIDDNNGDANALALLGYLNRSQFDHRANHILPGISGFETASNSIIDSAGGVSSVSHYLDPSNSRPHVMLKRGWRINDRIDQAQLDITLDTLDAETFASNAFLAGINTLHVGLRWSKQRKNNERRDNEANARHCEFCGYFSQPDIPNHFQQIFDAGDNFLGSVSGNHAIPKQWLQHDAQQVFDFLAEQTSVNLNAVSRSSSFALEETIWAGYLEIERQDNLSFLDIHSNWGIRYEDTHVNVSGFEEDLIELVILDQTELGQVTGSPRPVSIPNRYQHWLPSVNITARYNDAEPSDFSGSTLMTNLVGRFSFSRSITRPTVTQLAPSISFDTTRQGGDLRASAGDPTLIPFVSNNIDIALEYYYLGSSMLSATWFSKNVSHFIFSEVEPFRFDGITDPSTGSNPQAPDSNDEPAIFDLTRPRNGEQAKVQGIELSLLHHFGHSGVSLLSNMTFTRSNAELDVSNPARTFALTGLSDSANVMLMYDKHHWQLRLAYHRRDGFLQSLQQRQSAEPTFVAPYHQWDVTASYQLNPHITVFVEGINITNQIVRKHGRFTNQLLLVQDTGSRWSAGVRMRF